MDRQQTSDRTPSTFSDPSADSRPGNPIYIHGLSSDRAVCYCGEEAGLALITASNSPYTTTLSVGHWYQKTSTRDNAVYLDSVRRSNQERCLTEWWWWRRRRLSSAAAAADVDAIVHCQSGAASHGKVSTLKTISLNFIILWFWMCRIAILKRKHKSVCCYII